MRAKALPTFGPLLAALMLLAATGAAHALDFPIRTIRLDVGRIRDEGMGPWRTTAPP